MPTIATRGVPTRHEIGDVRRWRSKCCDFAATWCRRRALASPRERSSEAVAWSAAWYVGGAACRARTLPQLCPQDVVNDGSHIIVPCLQEVGAFRWSSGSCCSWGDPTRPGSPGSWLKRTIWVWVRCSSPWSTTVMAVMAITLQNLRKIWKTQGPCSCAVPRQQICAPGGIWCELLVWDWACVPCKKSMKSLLCLPIAGADRYHDFVFFRIYLVVVAVG